MLLRHFRRIEGRRSTIRHPLVSRPISQAVEGMVPNLPEAGGRIYLR